MIAEQFPALRHGLYLDSAATSQTPECVLEAMLDYYRNFRANVHRGAYSWSSRATEAYEGARQKLAAFIGAEPEQCIFTRGTTESLNLLAGLLCPRFQPGQRIVLTGMEHHSNLVPWQQWALRQGLQLDWVEVTPDGRLDLSSLQQCLEKRPVLLAMTWVSNVLGSINPVSEIAALCHQSQTLLVLDGAQGVPHLPCRVDELGCDFLAFSGHKMLGPTGIGLLWGKPDLLESLPPGQFGGSMVGSVERERTTFADLPQRLEAGTPPIAEAIGLGAAVDFLTEFGMQRVRDHEKEILDYALTRLAELPELHLVGPLDVEQQSGLVSFYVDGMHPHDLATLLDRQGIAVRAGHHCCQPLMRSLKEQRCPHTRAPLSLLRASFYLYNQKSDVDRLVEGLGQARKVLGRE
jgi:cysteine desulfurase/selenocysteine lyase